MSPNNSPTLSFLLSSLLLLYFQLIHRTCCTSSSQRIEIDVDIDDNTQDSNGDTQGDINTINKFGHILNADDSSDTDTSLQEEIAKLAEPNYLLIGVVKSGSTSLYHYMVQHPQITGVEAQYLLPLSMRTQISNIIKKRRMGKIPRTQPKPHPKGVKGLVLTNPGSQTGLNPQTAVKTDIYEINNFDLARMIKPIIDQKEVRFFDSFWYNHLQTVTNHSLLLGWKWYLDVFNQEQTGMSTDIIRGEASPTYFASSQFTAERIKLWLPNAKLILLLRNPVRRFVSHLKMIKENHASNMKFRKERQREMESQKLKNKPNARELLAIGDNNAFNAGNNQNSMNAMGYNLPFTPQTRYGRKNKQRKRIQRSPMQRFMRTRPRDANSQQLSQRYNEFDSELVDELDEDDIDDVGDHDNDAYIDDEIAQNERTRKYKRTNPLNGDEAALDEREIEAVNKKKAPPKPVNKMEKIIGSIYKLSMYQVILVSNANPDSGAWYQKRWGIGKDVSGFINRLLFGGIYTMRMKEWTKRFDDQHLFYRESSQLFDDPTGLMRDLEQFLGVKAFGNENWQNITSKVYNVELEKGKGYQHREVSAHEIEHWDITMEKETKIPHPSEDRKWQSLEIIEMLRAYYRPHNKQLSQLFEGKMYKDWDY